MSATESSEESITLEWVFDQGDVRLAQVYLAPKKEDEERIKLYNVSNNTSK
ncbi:hypothetical protein FRC03_011511 [Tulasnella sp. 419]|nr:hypothetical protein FRC03_011511 [Tulasnella sp. 419]